MNEKDEFYHDLELTLNSIPHYNLLIVAGDFNARVGLNSHNRSPRVVGKHCYHEKTNDNRGRLVSLCEAASMRLAQHRFPQPNKHQWTWMHTSFGVTAQIDYILILSKWINSLRNCRGYNTVKLDTNSRIVTVRIHRSLAKQREIKKEPP